MSFDMKDYKEVPERIAEFAKKYPLGSLQGTGFFVTEPVVGYHYVAKAYRTPDDPRPGVGTAFEPIPGKTPYTKDSEVMNAETSAWGRAIVALGFSTKKIASAEEVRARSGGVTVETTRDDSRKQATPQPAAPPDTYQPPAQVAESLAAKQASSVPAPAGFDGSPESVPVDFGKHRGKTLGEVPRAYLEWLAGDGFDPQTKDKRLLKNAARTMLGMEEEAQAVDPDLDAIPF
jgi:uncharacterized protein (DUF3820 family)